LHADIDRIRACAVNAQIAEAIFQMRSGNIMVIPGYDGVFGVVSVRTDKLPMNAQSKFL
jgi:PHP family Zn ribbon phosphoesterase